MEITSDSITTHESINNCVGTLSYFTDISQDISLENIPTYSNIAVGKISADAILGTDFKDEIYNTILSRLSAKPIIQHKCHNCGGTVELDKNKHIFICPYCDAHYAVGIYCGINDKGD